MRRGGKRLLLIVPLLLLLAMPLLTHRSKAAPTPSFSYYPVPTAKADLYGIVQGSDGNMWFTESSANAIGNVTPTGVVTEFPLPNANSDPKDITAGPDGALWFVEDLGNRIGRITTAGQITEYDVPTAGGYPTSITTGSDGALWFTEYNSRKLGRITTDGQITEYKAGNVLFWIRHDAAGNLWTADNITPNFMPYGTDGSHGTAYPVTQYSDPYRFTFGPDGALWFLDGFSTGNPLAGNRVGRLDTTTGQYTEYPFLEDGGPSAITSGTGNNLWVGWNGLSSRIYQVSTDGQMTDFSAGQVFGYIGGMTTDASGNLWFTDRGHNAIVKMNPTGTPPPPPLTATALALSPQDGTASVGSTASLQATATDINGNPVDHAVVRFSVSGSDTTSGSCTTDSDGTCAYTYNGPALPGADSIDAYVDSNDNSQLDTGEPVASATQAWLLPQITDGQIAGGGQLAGTDAQHSIAFGFTAKSNNGKLTGNCQLIDQLAGINLHCSSINSLVISGTQASIYGTAALNGSTAALNFRIDVTDNGEPGTADTFSLQTSAGYTASGTLAGGNIQVNR